MVADERDVEDARRLDPAIVADGDVDQSAVGQKVRMLRVVDDCAGGGASTRPNGVPYGPFSNWTWPMSMNGMLAKKIMARASEK